MSFILDALKKADAERHLGQMPGIHTQQLPVSEPAGPSALPRAKLVPAALIGIAAALAVGIVFWRTATHEPSAPASSPSAPRIAAAEPAPATQAALPAAPEQSAQPAPEPVIADEVPVPPPLPEPVAKKEAAPSPREAGTRKPASPAAATKEAADANASTGTAAPQARVMAISELPADVQRELPPLAVKGSMYSDNPANRMLLLDKRLLHEGDEIAPGLVLETLMPKAATLRYKQYRFQITY